MIDPEVISIIIQGGAVGILLAFGVGGFMLARLLINRGFEFVSNHMAHNTDAVVRNTSVAEEGVEVMRDVAAEVRRMSDKLGE